MASAGKPVDQLRAIGAPRELVEWVRKQPAETALRAAWVDATRADWLPYVAVARGIPVDAVIRATCECALDLAGAPAGAEIARVLDVLRAGTRVALAAVDNELADLRTQLVHWSTQTQPGARPAWMFWAELVFELGRATSRGNPLVGVALAMRMLATAERGAARPRASHNELVAKLRDKLTLASASLSG